MIDRATPGAPGDGRGSLLPLWAVLIGGIAGGVIAGIGARTGPSGVVPAGLAMVLLSSVGAFVIVLRDDRRNGTGWFRAVRRAVREAFSWFWDLLR